MTASRRPAVVLGLQAVRAAVEEGHLAHVVLPEHLHQQAREPEAEAPVRRRAEAEEVEVVLDRPRLDALVLGLREQLLVAVLALGAGRQLDAAPEQVEALGQGRARRGGACGRRAAPSSGSRSRTRTRGRAPLARSPTARARSAGRGRARAPAPRGRARAAAPWPRSSVTRGNGHRRHDELGVEGRFDLPRRASPSPLRARARASAPRTPSRPRASRSTRSPRPRS